jgi:uncharacterized protein
MQVLPIHRAGIGLKPQHYADVLHGCDSALPGWVEVHPQNYWGPGAEERNYWLSQIAERLPLSFHSVGLSLGSAGGLNEAELERLAMLCERYNPAMVSDHLSFSGNAHDRVSDLLPIPYTREALDVFVSAVDRVQERLGRQMLIENPARYLAYAHNDMNEVEFLARLIARTGCGLLLDINNVVVTCGNLGGAPADYLATIDPDWIGEVHLSGHAIVEHPSGPLHIDDHASAIAEDVWSLYVDFIATGGPQPTLVEWDNNIPDYEALIAEALKADNILNPPRHGEGDHPQDGGGAPEDFPELSMSGPLQRAPPPAPLVPLPVPGRNCEVQASLITIIRKGPDALDPALFAGERERVLLGLQTHAITINRARLQVLDAAFPEIREAMGAEKFRRLCDAFIETEAGRASEINDLPATFNHFCETLLEHG